MIRKNKKNQNGAGFSFFGARPDLRSVYNLKHRRAQRGRKEEEGGEHESFVHVENLSSAHRWAELNHSAAQNTFVADLV